MLAMGVGVGGSGGGGATPGGVNTNVQFNNNGAFGGSANLTFSGGVLQVNNTVLAGIPGSATGLVEIVSTNSGQNVVLSSPSSGTLSVPAYATGTNCSSSASPAVCGSAAAGSVVIAAAATAVTVNTTAITANSQVLLTRNDSLGTKLSVTCNTATVMGEMKVSARTTGTSFTITVQTAPATNPGCISYFLIN